MSSPCARPTIWQRGWTGSTARVTFPNAGPGHRPAAEGWIFVEDRWEAERPLVLSPMRPLVLNAKLAAEQKEVRPMKHVPPAEFLLLVVAIVLMLGGAGLMLADLVSPAIAIPLIAVGIALSVVGQHGRRRQHIPSH